MNVIPDLCSIDGFLYDVTNGMFYRYVQLGRVLGTPDKVGKCHWGE